MLKKMLLGLAEVRAKMKLRKAVSLGKGSTVRYRRIVPKKGAQVSVGEGSLIEGTILFDCENGRVIIGDRTFIGNSTLVCAKDIVIGNDVLMAWGCSIVDHNSHSINWSERSGDVSAWIRGHKNWSHVKIAPVKIGDKAWIGFNSILLKGVTIGEGAVVAAGSVVTKDVPPWTIVAGNPARVVRELRADER